MSKSIECEPFLDDYMAAFHSIFIPLDKSMSTSEIKPLHLSLPRNRQGVRNSNASNAGAQSPTAPRISNPTNNEVNDEGNNKNSSEKKSSTRFLSNHYLESSKSGKNSRQSTKDPSSSYKGINEIAQKTLPKNQPNANENDASDVQAPNQEIPSRPPRQKQLMATTQNDREVIEMLMRNDDYWFSPLSLSGSIRLIFIVSFVSSKYSFDLFIDGDESPLMQAEMLGQSRADGIKIMINGQQIGETHYTPGNSSLFAGVSVSSEQQNEACAAIYNPSFSSASQPRIFDFLVPALKKINGKSRMLPIPLDESSGLVARLSQMSKEAIRLKTRIPSMQGNSFDMTFDGKFQQASLSNFILYHDSNTRKDICSLGMISSSGHYLLEIGYPLSPIQGFLAAVSASAPL